MNWESAVDLLPIQRPGSSAATPTYRWIRLLSCALSSTSKLLTSYSSTPQTEPLRCAPVAFQEVGRYTGRQRGDITGLTGIGWQGAPITATLTSNPGSNPGSSTLLTRTGVEMESLCYTAIVIFLIVTLVLVVAACMLSSQISQNRGEWYAVTERVWSLGFVSHRIFAEAWTR